MFIVVICRLMYSLCINNKDDDDEGGGGGGGGGGVPTLRPSTRFTTARPWLYMCPHLDSSQVK